MRAIEAGHPELVVTIGRRATALAHARLPRTPIVFGAVREAERLDLHGPWVTGVLAEVSPAEELAALHRLSPGVRRVGIVYGRAAGAARMPAVRAAARAAHLELLEAPLDEPSELSARARNSRRAPRRSGWHPTR